MKKLASRITVEGLDRAPHRAFLRALGVSDDDLAKPFVGVASTDGRVTPCNALLGEFAREACAGVRAAGGVAFDFASISVADSISMNHGGMRYSLVSRELIADGVEAVARGHAYDALVTFAGCDKTLPGMMMAMVRLNLPAVFVYGGWDGTLYVNEEVKHRRHNPGRAAVIAVALLIVIYTFCQVGLQGVVSPAKLQANSSSVLVYIAQSLGGGTSAKVMALALALSVIASTGVSIVIIARMLYGMAGHRVLPPVLGIVSPRYATPAVASVVVGVVFIANTVLLFHLLK